MTEIQTEGAVILAIMGVGLALLAIPPFCRWRTVMYGRRGGGQVILSLTRKGALRVAKAAREEGYVRVRAYRL